MSHCATSLNEFTEGQFVRVVFGAGDVRPGVVERIKAAVVSVRLADRSIAECRPYAVLVEDDGAAAGPDEVVAPVQGGLFDRCGAILPGVRSYGVQS